MSERWKSVVGTYYRNTLAQHGPGARGMDWRDEASQRLRFVVIDRHIDWSSGPSILDVGCGSGGLASFFAAEGRTAPRYLGIDIVPEMVAAANLERGDGTARVATVADLRAEGHQFDYVVASGTFNVRGDIPDVEWRDHLETSLEDMWALCGRAIVFNVMTAQVDRRYPHLYYAAFDPLADFAVRRLSRRFVIDHDYPLFEFTMAVRRDPHLPPGSVR